MLLLLTLAVAVILNRSYFSWLQRFLDTNVAYAHLYFVFVYSYWSYAESHKKNETTEAWLPHHSSHYLYRSAQIGACDLSCGTVNHSYFVATEPRFGQPEVVRGKRANRKPSVNPHLIKGFDLGLPDGGVAQATSLGPKWIFADDEFFLFSPSLPGRFGHVKLDLSDLVVLISSGRDLSLG